MKNKSWILKGALNGTLFWLITEVAHFLITGEFFRFYLLLIFVPVWVPITFFYKRQKALTNER